jgi:hypothetical protein
MNITYWIDGVYRGHDAADITSTTETVMKSNIAAYLAFSVIAFGATSVSTQITADASRSIVTPFYDALNAAPGKDIPATLERATAPNWVSCGTNAECAPREKVIPNFVGFHKAVPDLKWEILEVLVSGNRIIVRGEASGTPAGDFMGVAHGGKAFKVMSIDIHTVEAGKIVRSYHLEDWMGATLQLSAK